METSIKTATETIKQGGIIAYPTEAVYGLGCDPLNQAAVLRLLSIKHRSPNKGLIVIGAVWKHIADFVKNIPEEYIEKAQRTWPGPFTWVFPKSNSVPDWIAGQHDTIALRITAHSIARAICETANSAIVSTSANLENQPPLKTYPEVIQHFGMLVDYIVPGPIGNAKNPTEIRDVMTGKVIRTS